MLVNQAARHGLSGALLRIPGSKEGGQITQSGPKDHLHRKLGEGRLTPL